jgi:hypothetical protein
VVQVHTQQGFQRASNLVIIGQVFLERYRDVDLIPVADRRGTLFGVFGALQFAQGEGDARAAWS